MAKKILFWLSFFTIYSSGSLSPSIRGAFSDDSWEEVSFGQITGFSNSVRSSSDDDSPKNNRFREVIQYFDYEALEEAEKHISETEKTNIALKECMDYCLKNDLSKNAKQISNVLIQTTFNKTIKLQFNIIYEIYSENHEKIGYFFLQPNGDFARIFYGILSPKDNTRGIKNTFTLRKIFQTLNVYEDSNKTKFHLMYDELLQKIIAFSKKFI